MEQKQYSLQKSRYFSDILEDLLVLWYNTISFSIVTLISSNIFITI